MKNSNNVVLVEVSEKSQMNQVAQLFRDYQSFLGEDLCFQGFEDELANLPGKYAHPYGAIFLAEHGDKIIGCVAVRPLKDDTCEMKRLYVKPEAQGLKAGRLLAEAIIDKAKALGYKKMQLDTLERLVPALKLYENLGFKRINSYYSNPLDQVVYLELELGS